MNTKRLFEILGLRRRHNSAGERRMINEQLLSREGMLQFTDPKTNEVLAYVYATDETSKTLFTAHTDTVHAMTTPGTEEIVPNSYIYDRDKMTVKAMGAPLGADDGAGVWLLLEMIDAGVPGYYLFPRGEECGGIGSSGLAHEFGQWLEQFDRCISFDRKGTSSVITHQRFSRCCSDEFAEALAIALTNDDYFYLADDSGVFTDSANFTDFIGECTNVSIGYQHEHTPNETLDLHYLNKMRDQCIAIDWEALPTHRKPGEIDPKDEVMGWGGWGHRSGRSYGSTTTSKAWAYMTDDQIIDAMQGMEYDEVYDVLQQLDKWTIADIVTTLLERQAVIYDPLPEDE